MRRKERNKQTIECSQSYDDIDVLKILDASFNEHYGEQPTMKQLIAQGKIKEAIDVFEEDFPEEGILLMSQFKQSERDYSLKMITKEDWDVKKQEIANSLLKLSENSE